MNAMAKLRSAPELCYIHGHIHIQFLLELLLQIRLVSMYVQSPLCWAVSAGAHGKYKTIEDLKDSTIAISRYTSGSHIMACVLAKYVSATVLVLCS